MSLRAPRSVAARCLCTELLLQRLGLEAEGEDDVATREAIRRAWAARLPDLGLDVDILPRERALLEAPVGTLDEDAKDDLLGRASAGLVLLWALGRLEQRPGAAAVDELESLLTEHGLLGDGSIKEARAAADGAELRDASELEDAAAAYERARGKSREADTPEKVFADVAGEQLEWVLDDAATLDEE